MIKHMITGKDNQTIDVARVGFIVGLIVYCGCTVYSVSIAPADKMFDMQSFGIGFGALCAGTGGMIGLKAKTEPEA